MPGSSDGDPVVGRTDGIWWRASGHGRPLLLIQGLGYPAAMWHRIVPLLEPHARVIVFDHRGIGNSSRANGLDGLTISAMASDAASVIQSVVEGPADVFGVSLGGIVGQELALAYPQLVRRLVLAATHTADARVVVADAEAIQMMIQRPNLNDDEALRSSVPYVYAPDTPSSMIEEDLSIRRALHTGWEGYKAQMRATVRYGGTSTRLPRIKAPTLVLHGDLDRLVPPGNAMVIHERLPKSQLRILPGVSHNLFSEAPELTAATVVEFLEAEPGAVPNQEVVLDGSALAGLPVADELLTSGAIPGIQPVGQLPFPTTSIPVIGDAGRPSSRAGDHRTSA